MEKRVYISADYSIDSGDRNVVDQLNSWGNDNYHKVNFVDMSKVVSGSVSKDPDCRPCDLKREFNQQINASAAVIFVIGDKTGIRTAGSNCYREGHSQYGTMCTPYKQNTYGQKMCKVYYTSTDDPYGDVGPINSYSYLRHEFEQAKKKGKKIIIVYNSLRKETTWLPSYMKGYESIAQPFWVNSWSGYRIGNYDFIKKELGYV